MSEMATWVTSTDTSVALCPNQFNPILMGESYNMLYSSIHIKIL